MVAEIKTMLIEHIKTQQAWNEHHDEKAEAWRSSVDMQMSDLKDFVSNARWSYKLLIGLSLAVGSVFKAFDYLKEHWK